MTDEKTMPEQLADNALWNEIAVAPMAAHSIVAPDGAMTLAVVQLTAAMPFVRIAWLPDFFATHVPADLRALLVAHLRRHADKLESGEMEAKMKDMAAINEKGTAQA